MASVRRQFQCGGDDDDDASVAARTENAKKKRAAGAVERQVAARVGIVDDRERGRRCVVVWTTTMTTFARDAHDGGC